MASLSTTLLKSVLKIKESVVKDRGVTDLLLFLKLRYLWDKNGVIFLSHLYEPAYE